MATTRKAATKTPARKAVKKPTPKKVAAKKAAAKKAAPPRSATSPRKAVAKKTATKNATTKKTVAGKPAMKKAAAPGTAPRKAAARAEPAKKGLSKPASTRSRKRAITPAEALANTRALLDAKHAHDRQAPLWQALDSHVAGAPHAGFQSDAARIKADELHAGESRMQAIQGSIGTQGRHEQGKRDGR